MTFTSFNETYNNIIRSKTLRLRECHKNKMIEKIKQIEINICSCWDFWNLCPIPININLNIVMIISMSLNLLQVQTLLRKTYLCFAVTTTLKQYLLNKFENNSFTNGRMIRGEGSMILVMVWFGRVLKVCINIHLQFLCNFYFNICLLLSLKQLLQSLWKDYCLDSQNIRLLFSSKEKNIFILFKKVTLKCIKLFRTNNYFNDLIFYI